MTSSSSLRKNSNNQIPMITIVDLNYSHNLFPLISQELVDGINATLEKWKKVLIFLNRRWEAGALICKDCSYQAKCGECDVAMNVHKYPREMLICHSCNRTESIPDICPACKWTNMYRVWTGTQKIEQIINNLYKDNRISRLDSDKIKKEWINIEDVKNSEIIIVTETANTISFDNLWLVIFPLFELELTIWDYDIEEKIYNNIAHNIKRWADLIIQTYIPKNPLLITLTEGNYKEFLIETLEERKKFWYPPYKELANIIITNNDKAKLLEQSNNFVNNLNSLNTDWLYNINYNKSYLGKKAWDFYQKIIIKWEDIERFLNPLRSVITRNRNMNIEWK